MPGSVSILERVCQEFERRWGTAPVLVVRAPGRVNLIGEHTDYNDGFVLPMAIDRAVWIAVRPSTDRCVRAHSLDFGQSAEFSLDGLTLHAPERQLGWAEYVRGVAWSLLEAGCRLRGWDGVVAGDVPLGAGLSSSAALEMAAARAFAATSDLDWDPVRMAKIGQRAENLWMGVRCGIMDQMISASGRAGHALLIDCRTLETEHMRLPPGAAVVVLDTSTRRGLLDSTYNERRSECEAAARFLGVPSLRDLTAPVWKSGQARAASSHQVILRRARHVMHENTRTLEAAEAMRQADAMVLGRLMSASHASLRDDFEVSSVALDAMVTCAQRHPGCYGARMTGAGFGGCAVALVQDASVEDFVAHMARCYHENTGVSASVYVCEASNGAEIVSS